MYAGAGGSGSSGSNTGGDGGNVVSDSGGGGGGGGGGGYQPNGTGGGAGGSAGDQVVVGGGGGGGAGGHSFSAASDAVIAPATATGNGKVVITWTPPAVDERYVSSGRLSSSMNPSYLGEPVTFTLDLDVFVYAVGTVTIGTYDPTTGVELPQATWLLDMNPRLARQYTWSVVLPTGMNQIWASFAGDGLNKPWKSPYFTQLVGNVRPRTVLALPSSSVDFGAQPVGTTSTRTVTIENISAAPWRIASVSATEPAFSWTGGTCSSATTTPLALGASCTIDLSFTPTAVPAVGGSLTLLDEVGLPTVLTMSGSGIAVPVSGPTPAPGAPTITSLSPSSGSRRGGTWVTIVGTNLVNVTSIKFGSKAATQVTCSSTTCRVRSPKGSGSVDVRVVTPAGTSATTATDRFRYTG